MSEEQKSPGLIVEDADAVGGINEETGEARIETKTPDGTAPKGLTPTDPNEARHE